MRKTLPLSLLLTGLALFLAGCASRQANTPTATQAPAPTQTASASVGRCTASSLSATPDATTTSIFPQPGAADWTNGPASAQVTFIEYGDFM